MRRSAGRGGVDSPGGDNSGGSSQSDQIETDVNIYTVKFSVRGDDLVIPENAVYKWSFGDGAEDEGRTPEHTYAEAGTYPVSVTITGTASDGTDVNYNFKTSVILKEVPREASNSYLYAEKNQENPLNYSFYTPLTFSGVPSESVTYEWQYDTTIAATPSEKNVFNHTYDIYGKTYKARVTAKTGELTSSADVTITIPKPEVNLVCSSQGLSVTCYPEITLDGEKVDIPMDFEWDCGNNGEITVTSGTEPKTCFYKEGDSGSGGEGENKKTITVTGKSEYITGTITDTEEVSISNILNVAPLNCNLSAGSDRLTWTCSINTTLKEQDGAKPTGKLEYQWHFGETAGEWTPLEEAQEGYHSKTYTYAKYRNDIDNSPYKVQVKVKYTGDGYQEEGASSYTITIDAPTVQISQNPASNNKFERTFSVIWPDYTPAGDLTYIWDFGDKTRTEGDRTITHTYKSNGEYEVKLEVKSKDGVFVDGFVKPVTLLLDINENLDVPTGPNAITKTPHPDNPLIWDFKIDGVSSTTGEIVYQWKKDGQVIANSNSPELKNIELEKFGQSYPITVDVSIKNTNIKKTVSTSVVVNPPVVEIVLPKGNIVEDTAATFDNTILYNGQDARKWLKDIKYQWTIDNKNFTTQTATNTWAEPGDGKKADLTITASNVVGDMRAQQKTFTVSVKQTFGSIVARCYTPDTDINTIRHICTGYAADTEGNPMELENPNKYRFVWTAAGGIDSSGKEHYNNGEAAIILNWPDEKRANKTGEDAKKTFTVFLKVYDTENNDEIIWGKDNNVYVNLTVKRYIGYKATVRNSGNGQGENIKNIIDIKDLTNIEGATYKWIHQLNTAKHGKSSSNVDNPFHTGQTNVLDFTNEANNYGFIGKVSFNPFNNANGIGLQISGGPLSAPVEIWGLDVADGGYQMFGPSIIWCSTSGEIIRMVPYENEADSQLSNIEWGDDQYGRRIGNLIYLWQTSTINTTAKVSKDTGDFAEITLNRDLGAQSLADIGLKVKGSIKTTQFSVKLNSEGSRNIGNGLVFYFDKNNPNREGGNMPLLLKVKDTTAGYQGQWYTYGTCVRGYTANPF